MAMKYKEVVRLVNEVLTQYQEATVRQIYYRLVSPPYQYMANTRSMYTSFDVMLTHAREEGLIDWRQIVDRSRTVMEPEGLVYEDIEDFMSNLKSNLDSWWQRYAIDLWEGQEYRLKVFVEKDALAGIVSEIALPQQVSVIPGRGYNSFSQLMSQAESFRGIDKSIILLYFGDFDPSGLDIDRSAYERLSSYSGADIKMFRIALTEDDIASLPPNPTKAADSRSRDYVAKYGDRCWELDALPPDQLRGRVRQAIDYYKKVGQWAADQDRLMADRQTLKARIENLYGKEDR